MTIRKIQARDNQMLGTVIRQVFKEFGIDRPGTAYYDPELFSLSTLFETPGSAYWVAEIDGELVGGGGIFPTKGLDSTCVELVKFYLLPKARGKGFGKELLLHCCAGAKEMGYQSIYLETMPELTSAVPLYEKTGFRHLSAPSGCSGHFACSIWMQKELV
ncbi:GNAT family N-acetyltransferase [Chitinophaga sancti]|uniref:GNAT family N-acetyltransferase n=1 Tax=Chitinophaga sancti TaxID=1004 RepID=A0A1K1RSI9_9BACT|nr:GNAT family N-acetyltransferase [Chitinophaga sancti]WQD62420.1 GNAT family N-acetyltransferase [Chitinophaga sancti]WQG92011.1 GNAT family N-acetyltransferase [Chitinophaga sancti]SFW75259.1 putative acetyltransferase [Chitinophaga sancti]